MRHFDRPWVKALLAVLLLVFLSGGTLLLHYYNVYAEMIDKRLTSSLFEHPSLLYAAPVTIFVGEQTTAPAVAVDLRRAGYSEGQPGAVGSYTVGEDAIEVRPGPEAVHSTTPAIIEFENGAVSQITDASTNLPMNGYDLEPEPLTTLFDQKREKRELLRYQQLPPLLIEAVLDIEDRDFYEHGAVNWWRVPAAAYRDLRSGRREQGASTITMQVARNFFPTPTNPWRRKVSETIIAFELEQRLTKEQIFELYANQLYMGQRGTYSIHGFGEASEAYFGVNVDQLTLPEAALLAGIIHGPNLDSPYRHPERARLRRNQVLQAMARAGSITTAQARAAEAEPVRVTADNDEATDAPYFVDLVRDRLSEQIPESDLMTQSYRIYTTLDPDLQAAAAQAVAAGMKTVDQELTALRTHKRMVHGRLRTVVDPGPQAQVALIALDPHTGEVKALVGGRNYALSQLDHAVAPPGRPTGSIFKPFVYATALETGLLATNKPITETTTLMDVPTTFEGNYAPKNFEDKYYGQVTLRTALAHSLNNATIALALKVGLDAVTDLAHSAGITSAQATPSEAIGTYDATPMEMAEAYTIFANEGVRETPRLVDSVRSSNGVVVYREGQESQPVLDPRVAFLATNLMQSVLQFGTGERVHQFGFDAPAAGKTGTSHDAWFAGYTSNLECIVWVGLDDYEDIHIQGADAALPIWAPFMKAALALPAYHNVTDFVPPPGVVAVTIDTASGEVATPLCPKNQLETDYYLSGTEPTVMCHLHPVNLAPRGLIGRALNLFESSPPPPAVAPPPMTRSSGTAGTTATSVAAASPAPAAAPPPPPKKKGIFGKILHVFGGGHDQPPPGPGTGH